MEGAANLPFRDFWRRYFHFYDTLNAAQPYTSMIARLVDGVGVRPGERVLDAGTGTGNVASEIVSRGASVVGVDFCEFGLEKCRAKVASGDFRLADITRPLEFRDGEFDRVTCSLVLQYISPEAAQDAVREFRRVVRPGGLVGLTVFARGFNSLAVYWDAMKQHRRTHSIAHTAWFAVRHLFNTVRILYYVRQINTHEKRGDYTYYDSAEAEALLRNAGLDVVEISPVFASQSLVAIGRKPEEAR